ncbi:ATP-binding protein [Microscilla marina]|uniref:histidine kinase n=1 Tax=Microscilla marina ATCC 23134 TaxID=313606 RepID=A1ZRB1_MICM2|nr:ATP-binding protein [Microscilla marina]EAY27001.1 two-component hybrid sensor and regulator, putative [Microscilla marina ATCC 23134]
MKFFTGILLFLKCIVIVPPLFAQNTAVDSLAQLLEASPKVPKTHINLLLKIAENKLHINHQEALVYSKQALELSQKYSLPLKTAQSYKMLGLLYRQKNDFALCKKNYELAIEAFKKLDRILEVANIYVSMGIIHRRQANYTESLRLLFKGMDVFEATNNETGKARVYNSIAITYGELGVYSKSMDYNFKSLHIYKNNHNQDKYALVLGDIAYGYYKKNDFKPALRLSRESELLSRKINKPIAELWAIGIRGLVYEKQRKYKEAIAILEKVTQGFGKIKARYLETLFKTHLGYALASAKQYSRAEEILAFTLADAKKRKTGELWVLSLLGLYHIHKNQQEANKALYYQGRYIEVRDSLYNQHKNQEFSSMQLSFQMDKERVLSQQMLAQKQLEIDNKNLALKQQNTLLYTSAIIALLLIVIIVYIFRSRQRQIKFNQTLAKHNQEINERKKEIVQQTEELRATNERLLRLDEFKQRMTGMIVHDLKNPLNAIIGLSGKKYSPQFQKTIHQSGIRMLHLVMNILDVQRFEEAQIQLNLQPQLLKQVVQQAHEQVSLSLAEKGVLFRQDVPENLTIKADEALIVRVFVNLFNNAIKYTPAQGKITVTLEDMPGSNFQKILVNDTGKGIAAHFIAQVFNKFSRQTSPAQRVHSSGLGLTFCKQVIEAHTGEIGVQSEEGKGSTFWFTLPKTVIPNDSLIYRQGLAAATPEGSRRKNGGFNLQEKAILIPYVHQLQKMEIYELTAIKNILGQLPKDNEAIQQWKKELENTLYSWNEVRFKELLAFV